MIYNRFFGRRRPEADRSSACTVNGIMRTTSESALNPNGSRAKALKPWSRIKSLFAKEMSALA